MRSVSYKRSKEGGLFFRCRDASFLQSEILNLNLKKEGRLGEVRNKWSEQR